MVKKVHYTWKDVEHMIMTINNLMYADGWRPDYIVGLTRGGLVPAVMMSNMTGITMHALDVRFRDTDPNYSGPETNCWMAEDAFGYVSELDRDGIMQSVLSDPAKKKKILIIDDINDTGKTLNWIKNDWPGSCFPDNPNWDTIWHDNVRFACLIDNAGSNMQELDYTALEIDKREDPTWVVFPWEGERDYGKF
jgi:hypoxanthine phosphoribosyltransferase